MDVYFDRTSVVRLYLCCRQAACSVHRGHAGEWSALPCYYDVTRRASVLENLRRLHRALPEMIQRQRPLAREAVGRRVPVPGFWQVAFGGWLARFRSRWSIGDQEVHFIHDALAQFLEFLGREEKPAAEHLIALRMNLATCEGILEWRAYGLPEFALAAHLEHFDRTEWLPAWKVEDVLSAKGRRRTAIVKPMNIS